MSTSHPLVILCVSTPKYDWLWKPFLACLERNMPRHDPIPVTLVSDGHSAVSEANLRISTKEAYPLTQLETPKEMGWMESRIWALQQLPDETAVILLQEDFLVERPINVAAIRHFLTFPDVATVRLMPSPAPRGDATEISYTDSVGRTQFLRHILTSHDEDGWCVFSQQAALWRKPALLRLFQQSLERFDAEIRPRLPATITPAQLATVWARANPLEGDMGAKLMRELATEGHRLLGVPRDGAYPNGVYGASVPLAYRPTAVERGKLLKWAEEFLDREGLLDKSTIPRSFLD